MSISFGQYHFQVGGHGLTDDTGLLTLFHDNAICKPLGIDPRAVVESLLYRDIMIALCVTGNISPLLTTSQRTLHENNDVESMTDPSTPSSDAIYSGWFAIDTIPSWQSCLHQHCYQYPFIQQLTQFLTNPVPPSTFPVSSLLTARAYHYLQQFKLPMIPSCPPTIPPTFSPLSTLPPNQQLYFLWYFRSLHAKASLFPTPLGFIVKHITCNSNSNENPNTTPETVIKPYLALESLSVQYKFPAIIDIKTGQCSWDLKSKYDKMSYELIKYPLQSDIGFRLVGANVPVVYSKPRDPSSSPSPKSIHDNNNNNNNGDDSSAADHVCELITRHKLGRKDGQAVMTREQLIDQFLKLFLFFILPTAKPEFYQDYPEHAYAQLRFERYALVHDLLTVVLEQLQVVLLLLILYPTHHIVASSVLICFEADPVPCLRLVQDWKRWKLAQFIHLFHNNSRDVMVKSTFFSSPPPLPNSTSPTLDDIMAVLSHDQWDAILSQTHEEMLSSVLKQYIADQDWYTQSEQTILGQDSPPSALPTPFQADFTPFVYSSTSPTLPPPPLPVTLKLIDFAHADNDIDHRANFEAWKLKQCEPLNTKYPLPHYSPEKRSAADKALPDPVWTQLGATIERYRNLFEGFGRKDVKSLDELKASGILTCSACTTSNESCLPSFLPKVYQDSKELPGEAEFGATDIDWHFLHLCAEHHCYAIHPSVLKQHMSEQQSALPVVNLLPQPIQQHPAFLNATHQSLPSTSPLAMFTPDFMFLNGIKSLLAYLLYIQRHHLVEHRRDIEFSQ